MEFYTQKQVPDLRWSQKKFDRSTSRLRNVNSLNADFRHAILAAALGEYLNDMTIKGSECKFELLRRRTSVHRSPIVCSPVSSYAPTQGPSFDMSLLNDSPK
jgi:hypothetical protein